MFISISSSEEDEFFYDCCVEDLTFWQCFLFSLWSQCVFACKFCDILQTLIASWLAKSMNFFGSPPLTTLEFQPPHPLKPKTLSQKLFFKTRFWKGLLPQYL
jgi:hypothetical protein